VQYFELGGNRGIYTDVWGAGIRYLLPWQGLLPEKPNDDVSFRKWELYNLNQDFSQAHDLAARNPAKLQELQTLFDTEAQRNQVYPLAPLRASQPSPAEGKKRFVYRDGVKRLTLKVLPDLAVHSHTLTADVVIPAVGGTEGVIVAEGGRWGGYTLFVQDGHLVYEVNSNGVGQGQITSSQELSPGKNHIAVDVTLDDKPVEPDFYPHRNARGATARLTVNGTAAGDAHFKVFGGLLNETLDLGSDLGSPVSRAYATPFNFTGSIEQVVLELK
jgi:arylsulfatase